MKCSDRNLGEEQLFERIDKYLCGELSENEDRDLTEHIMECQSCYETLLIQQLTKRIVNEYEDQIFPQVKETTKEDDHISPRLVQDHIPTLWLMLNNTIKMKKIEYVPCSIELPGPALYSLYHAGKPIGWQENVPPGRISREGLHAPHHPKITTIEIPMGKKRPKKKIIVRVEHKEGQIILSLSLADN